MLYTTFTVGGKEYQCRLTAKACVDLEKRMGGNPLNVFTKIQQTGEMPRIDDIITILHASMQALNHGISMEEVYNIYDEYVDEGNSLMELIPVIVEIFRVSGFFKDDGGNAGKNLKVEKK